MLRTLTAVGAMLGVVGTTSLASAQAREFGTPGEFIISADRLVPLFAYTRVVQQNPNNTPNTSLATEQTSISLLWGENTQQPVFFTVPRAGFDYTVIPNLTVGGDLAIYFSLGSNQSLKQPSANGGTETTSSGDGGLFLFGIAPRVGYILRLNRIISFWFRGGFSFYTQNTDTAKNGQGQFTRFMTDEFALDIDPQVVFTFVPHFGVTAGLTLDVPLSGEMATTSFNGMGGSTEFSNGNSILFFGATVGLIGYF
jgi:hypothetical protein